MSPFRMILQNADVSRKAAPPPKEKKEKAAVAPAPARQVETATAPPPEEPKAEQVSVAPASAQLARAPEPPPPPPPVELVPLRQDPPSLSATLRREQPQGVVKVAFAVKPDGSTGDVKVLNSTNHKLNSASVDAVTGWRFKPIPEVRPMEVELIFKND